MDATMDEVCERIPPSLAASAVDVLTELLSEPNLSAQPIKLPLSAVAEGLMAWDPILQRLVLAEGGR